MHYWMPNLPHIYDPLRTVDDFLEGKKNVERNSGSVINIEENKLPQETRVIVLSLE